MKDFVTSLVAFFPLFFIKKKNGIELKPAVFMDKKKGGGEFLK